MSVWRCAWCLLLAVLGAVALTAHAAEPLLLIDQGRLQAVGAPDAAAQDVTLPYKVYRPRREFIRYRLEASFDAPPALVQTRGLLRLDSWPDGGRLLINGVEVAEVPTSQAKLVVRYLRPFAFVLPRGLLRPQGNQLVMEWGSRETLVLVPRPLIGARDHLEPLHERQLFWEHTVLQGSLVFAAVVALVMLAVWWPQRHQPAQREYLLIGLSALGWILFNTVLLWSPVPAAWFPWRRAIGALGIGLFVICLWVCLVRLVPWRSLIFETVAFGWVALGPVLLLGGLALTGASHLPRAETLWAVGLASLGLVPLVVLLHAAAIKRTRRLALLLGFVLISLGLAVREAWIYIFQDPTGTVHIGLQILAPLWLSTACGILVQDFVRSLRAAESQRAELDRRLAEREAELARLYARDRDLATVEERQRIMQDMHDGLGSQLVSSLALAESGHLQPAQVSELLRSCIDDLRLAIDTLGEGEVDLGLAAGNLRFRIEPRLRAAGLRLRWDASGLPDNLSLPGSVALPVLRVLQEALSNALKHSGAQTLQVRLAVQAQAIELQVHDDGRGFDPSLQAIGKGLAGMRKRARGLNAELSVQGDSGGSTVSLRLPLP